MVVCEPDNQQSLEPNADREQFRVGIFSESFRPVQNGVTTSVLTLLSGLRDSGHQTTVFAPTDYQSNFIATVIAKLFQCLGCFFVVGE